MSIFRVRKDANYSVINNTGLRDPLLSWKAKGILAYALSLPDDWTFHVEELAKHAKDGEDSLRSGINELKKTGYVKRYPVRDEDTKKIIRWEFEVHEKPIADIPEVAKPYVENPHMENPEVAKPDVENPTLLNTKEQSTNLPNTDRQKQKPAQSASKCDYSSEFEEVWEHYPRKKEKKKAYQAFLSVLKNYPIHIIRNGVQGYADEVKKNRTEERYIKHPTTFFRAESFLDYKVQEQKRQTAPKQSSLSLDDL